MNILYLISYAGQGGAEKYVEDLMRRFSSRGCRCHLAFREEGALSRWAAAASYPLLRLDLRGRNVLRAARRLAVYCRENSVEVIHAQFPRENVIAVASKLFRGETRVVFTSHLTADQGIKWHCINRWITPHDSAVIALYSGARESLEKNGVDPRRICVIPNGVETGPCPSRRDVIRREYSLDKNCFVFVTLARFAPEKGLGVLIDAAARLREKTSQPFICLAAGEGEELEELRGRIRSQGLEGTVICPGYRSDAEALLCSADAYISPSLSEAMSYSILEAMACALPLAVTDTGAGRELAEGCGFVSAPGDADALAENMLRLMNDREGRLAMGAEAYRRVTEEYVLNRQIDATDRIYQGENR